MSDSGIAALRYLAKHGAQTYSNLGLAIWGKYNRKPQAYARPAGSLIKRLRNAGFVGSYWNKDRTHELHGITTAGRRLLSQLQQLHEEEERG